MTFEAEFEQIAQEAIEQAEAIECSFGEFLNGLQTIINELQARLDFAEDEAADNV